MVSSLLVDTLKNPTQSLLDLYAKTTPIDGFPAFVSRHFSDIFSRPDALQEIPTLDTRNPPEAYADKSLVRFRAMVQDTSHSPEMYLAKRRDGRCGGWGLVDTAHSDCDSVNYGDLRMCTVIWAINIPGESDWCSSEIDGLNAASTTRSHKSILPHKFPIPGVPHVGVQVKRYNAATEALKAADILTFVGILTFEPLHFELEVSKEVPTLHVLFSQPLPPTLIPRTYPAENSTSALREELISWIAEEALGGDRDAAEWVLLTSIARTQSRSSSIFPPSLTLSRFVAPKLPTAIPTLSYVLAELLPISLTLPLSLDTLNQENFIPESRQEDLHSGFLQVAPGTSILVTEGGICVGNLVEKGIMNLQAMQNVMTSQTIAYIFPFSKFLFQTDTTFVVLTEGRKSAFFKTSVTVPLRENISADLYKGREHVNLPPAGKLAAFRALVGGAKAGNVQVRESMSEHIQENFVQERQQNGSMTSEDLIHRMTTARYVSFISRVGINRQSPYADCWLFLCIRRKSMKGHGNRLKPWMCFGFRYQLDFDILVLWSRYNFSSN